MKRKRLLVPIAALLGASLHWYSHLVFFTPVLAIVVFCALMQLPDKLLEYTQTRPVAYEDLDGPAKSFYLVFLRLSCALALAAVVDYVLLFYPNQPLYNTVGIVGGLYSLFRRVEKHLAKAALLFVYHVVHNKHPYENHGDQPAEDR